MNSRSRVSPLGGYPDVTPLGKPLPQDVALAAATLRQQRRKGRSCGRQATEEVEGPRSVENYIPLRYPDLRDRLVEAHPALFEDLAVRAGFYRLAELMSLRNTIRLTQAFRPLAERYAYLDPDMDTTIPDLTGAGLSSDARTALVEEFEAGIRELLLRGGFEVLGDEQLTATLSSVGVSHGLAVRPPDPATIVYKIFTRGVRMQEVQYRSWRTLYLTRSARVPVFQRLAIVFRARSDKDARAMGSDEERAGWFRRTLIQPWRSKIIKVAESTVSANQLYMKLFRDIEVSDADMLLPGSVVRFSWFDWVMIAGPVLFGLVSAITKAVRGSLNFDTLQNIVSSVLLVILPVTWAVRAYWAVMEKRRLYTAHLNRVFLLHNLNNNSGVISQILEEAREQEDDEAILAYFFLWRGQQKPEPMQPADLDASVEAWVNQLLQGGKGTKISLTEVSGTVEAAVPSNGAGAGEVANLYIDFQVRDAVDRLLGMGAVKEEVDAATGANAIRAVGLAEALAAADLCNAPAGCYPDAGPNSRGGGDGGRSRHIRWEERGPGGRITEGGLGAAKGGAAAAADDYPEVEAKGLYFSPVFSAKKTAAMRAAAAAHGSGSSSRRSRSIHEARQQELGGGFGCDAEVVLVAREPQQRSMRAAHAPVLQDSVAAAGWDRPHGVSEQQQPAAPSPAGAELPGGWGG